MSNYCDIQESLNRNACRACLNTKYDHFVSLQENEISQLYEFCVGIYVTAEDDHHLLCNKCLENIKNFADFKKLCLSSEKLWDSYSNLNLKCYAAKLPLIKDIKNEKNTIDQNLDHCFNNDEYEVCNYKKSNCKNEIKHSDNENNDFNNGDVEDIKPAKNILKENKIKSFNKLSITFKQENQQHISKTKVDEISGNNKMIKVMECGKCKKEYKKKKFLVKHMKNMCYKNSNISNLVIVNKYRPSISTVRKSTEIHCGLCKFSSNNEIDIKEHLNEHWNKQDLQCKLCSYVGYDLAEIIGHRTAHQPYELFSIAANRCCHICDKRTASAMRLQYHYRSVHLSKKGGLCSVCRKTFRCFTNWRNHERMHKSSRYICDLCGAKFLYRSQIKIHLIEHSDVKMCLCYICGRAFKRSRYLKTHIDEVHTKESVKCTHCDKIFKNPAKLKEHSKQISVEKKFRCEVCLKYFATPTVLKNHMFWHTGEKPYGCEKCGRRYKAKSQLKIHMRKHTGERPYQCELCDKCFPTTMQLKRHQSVHTGERPYKCTVCSKSFHYKKLLLIHGSSKHKDVKREAYTN